MDNISILRNKSTSVTSSAITIKLVPDVGPSGESIYSEYTPDLYKLMKAEFPSVILEWDADSIYESKHSADIILPLIRIGWDALQNIGASVFGAFLHDFIKSRVRRGEETNTNAEVKLEILMNSEQIIVRYEGKVSGLESLNEALSKLK